MAFIYKITNLVNQKSYVGKTQRTVDERFLEHVKNMDKPRCVNRPLYRAFKKHGIENFSVELLEECSVDTSANREQFWIEELQTFHNGYNATLGGDGTSYLDYDLIIKTYKEFQDIKQVASLLGCDKGSVRSTLKVFDIPITPILSSQSKAIAMYDKKGNLLKSFTCVHDGARYLGNEEYQSHIKDVCNGKRKSAYGYVWRFA